MLGAVRAEEDGMRGLAGGRTLVGSLLAVLLTAPSTCKKDAPEEQAPAEEQAAEAPAEVPQNAEEPPRAQKVSQGTGAPTPEPSPQAAPPARPPTALPPPVAPQAPPPSAPPPVVSRPPLPDLRLLLTANDVADIAGAKVAFRRSSLVGVPATEDQDSLYYEPEKGTAFGFAIQVFRGATPDQTRERYASMLASYPAAVEVNPVAGKTFFAWWDEVLFIGFVQPAKNLVVVLSCGRRYCDSDRLYELARKVATRAG